MFCPQCNVEYRPGFTRCSDCDVDLVQDPPHFALAGKQPAEPGNPDEDPFCSFWKGQDARVHAELCEVLDEAGIPHKTVFRSDHLFNLSNYPAFEVGIPFSLFEKAEKAVEAAFGTEDIGDPDLVPSSRGLQSSPDTIRKLPPALTPPVLEDIPGPPTAGDADWYPEDATEAIWSTETDEPSDFLVAALHENGINCRLDQQGTHARLFVLPHDAPRAREILREIAEGLPPE
jgi:hypothetical protein